MAKIRMGMVGGGEGGFIGQVHRIGAAMDGEIELVCGAFSSDPTRSKRSGEALYLPPERVYGDYSEMMAAEAALHQVGGGKARGLPARPFQGGAHGGDQWRVVRAKRLLAHPAMADGGIVQGAADAKTHRTALTPAAVLAHARPAPLSTCAFCAWPVPRAALGRCR